ncbi:MAG: TetR/AcrR family transcriptional regulator, partial [Marmoricola sp.]
MATRWGDRQARDADIRESARRLLRERGYVGLTMRQVASGAGIALGSVYLYYPSKEDLFASLYIERLEQIIEELSTQLFEAATLGEAIVQFATGYMEVYRQFGKDVDLYALAASDRSDDNGSYDRFLATAARIFDTAWAGL